tara:strand:+ start:265 stop:1752 length:1488 start_codon:yes stop_codon:yes gene_type:complete
VHPLIKNKNLIIYLSFFIILLGAFLRFYNLNFENFWFDEIVSFWVSDPKITFAESYQRNNIGEGTPFLFNFLIKILHIIFGYTPNISRYLSCTFGLFSIVSMVFLIKTIKKNNSYLFIIFLVSFNIFLIKYSQEARVYSLVFFLCSMSLIFYFRTLKESVDQKYLSKNSFCFIFFQILSILAHPFTFIIFGSIVLYAMINFIFKKNSNRLLNTSIIVISIFAIFYLPYYLINTEPYPSWVSQPDVKFYTNFYFSKFFGSRILGLAHLLILFYLIFRFRKKLFSDLEPTVTLVFIAFFSYFIPIIFGYLHEPILAPRYIIFVLIPIITLISYLTFELNEKKIKYFIIFIIPFLNIGNLWTETTIQQFFKERPSYKAQYVLALEHIDNSKHKNFIVSTSFLNDRKHFNEAINNYLQQIIIKDKLNIDLIEIETVVNNNYFWFVCLDQLNNTICGTPKDTKFNFLEDTYSKPVNQLFKVVNEKKLLGANLKLIKLSNN